MTMDTLSFSLPAKINHNTCDAELVELAIARGEGKFSASGALSVETGVHTGRSVQDKFIVRDASTEPAIWWDNNKPHDARAVRPAVGRFPQACRGAPAVRAGPLCRRQLRRIG